jgi:Met-zincin
MKRCVVGYWLSAVLALGMPIGCASTPGSTGEPGSEVLTDDALFVAISRDLDSEAMARRSATPLAGGLRMAAHDDDFYLAVRRSALEEKWFWSVFLKEFQPFGPLPFSLGTKVIRFREQNDKLYVFDADDRRATSDVFDPDLIIDAFPIVDSAHFNSLPGSGGFILIDPAAGQNRFGALSDFFGSDPGPVRFQTELSFVQGFRPASDGGSYEQIITGYTDLRIGIPGDVDPNEFRAAATLGVSLRRYTQSAAYREVAPPPIEYYFLSDPRNVPNTGEQSQVAIHWGFAPGMKPIRWAISPVINQIAADPALGGANLFQAMKRGIESWNAVFGYPVFTAELAGPNDVIDDDHTNYVVIDPDISKGFAFADFRTNPNTGEIRGASVYYGGGFFLPLPDDPPSAASAALGALPKPTMPRLVWQDQKTAPSCVLWAPRWEPDQLGQAQASLTGAQKLELLIQETVTHEIGHTLGLRHNFKGSLVPPSSTVMEYGVLSARTAHPTPGPYDEQAIHYLYGQSSALPTSPFCNDEDLFTDPNCVQFDPPSPTPLTTFQVPRYRQLLALLFGGSVSPVFTSALLANAGTQLYAYARAGTPAEATVAWQAALDGVRAPLSATQASNPVYAAAADAISAFVYRELYLAPVGLNQIVISDPAVIAAVASDGKGIVINADGARSYATRRTVIDALKQAQNLDAYLALLDARETLAGQLGGLGPVDQALTRDLIARLDAATSPYFQ